MATASGNPPSAWGRGLTVARSINCPARLWHRQPPCCTSAQVYSCWAPLGAWYNPLNLSMNNSRAAARRINGTRYTLYLGNCLEWMTRREPSSIHAIVTDPPYGLKEYTDEEKLKLRNGRGGVWRIPPTFDGCERSPVPRFTVLDTDDRAALRQFFGRFADAAMR